MNSLKYIFEPGAVAVIGASPTAGSVGNAILSNILLAGFQGTIYPVNPRHSHILSLKTYANVGAISDQVDMAVVCVPKEQAEIVIQQCADKGIKGVVLVTAGFKEIGSAGKAMEERIRALCDKYEIALIGPNVLGVINTQRQVCLNANFAIGMPEAGNVTIISQSGAIGVAALDYAHQHHLGISKFISIGNKAVIDESDVLDYLVDDAETHIIAIYAEDISRPARFLEAAKRARAVAKPVLIIKTGRSVRGAVATQSHTGALSTSDVAYDSLFAQCGVIRVETLAQLFESAAGFTGLARPKGDRVVVLTNGGGMGVIATDAIEKNGLQMTTFEPATIEALTKALPPTANVHNPVDIIGDADADRLNRALTIISADKNVDALIVSILPTGETDMDAIARCICAFAKANPAMPVFGNLLSLDPEPSFVQILEKAKIPNFDFPETNVRVLATLVNYYKRLAEPRLECEKPNVNKKEAAEFLESVQKNKRTHLTEPECYRMLGYYGLKAVDYRFEKTLDSLVHAAGELGYPVVMKVVSPDILHKIDVGGVKINLKNEIGLKDAFAEMEKQVRQHKPDAVVDGYLIQKYFTQKGMEVIVGANEVKGFGPLVMFGLGGTYVEIFKDVAFRLAPLNRQDAVDMILETKGSKILKGFRGQAAYDMDALVDCLLRLSQLVTDFPQLKELDLNPVTVLEAGKGIVVMDAKAVLS